MGDVVPLKKNKAPWDAGLLKNKQGAYVVCLNNAVLILAHDKKWHNVVAYDAFADRVVKMKPPPLPDGIGLDNEVLGDWTKADSSRAAVWITNKYNLPLPTHIIEEAIQVVADMWVTHPVRDWLNEQRQKWDHKSRVDDFLIRVAGAKDTLYVRSVTKNFFLSAVARVFHPGEKVDAMLILEGEQNVGKSRLFRILSGDAWFFDSAFDPGSKDSYQILKRKWIIEWAELDGLTRVEMSRIKAFVSSSVDTYRPTYAKQSIDVPRQCVFVGTVNPDGAGYLNDPTGERRFWPVTVGKIDLKAVRDEREQLWAEAVFRYRQNEPWHLHAAKLVQAAAKETEKRRIRDPWEESVREWLNKYEEEIEGSVSTEELLGKAIKMPKDRRTRADQMRMVRVLRVLGWAILKKSTDGSRRYLKGIKT
jgi:putative DNA primase/helicase